MTKNIEICPASDLQFPQKPRRNNSSMINWTCKISRVSWVFALLNKKKGGDFEHRRIQKAYQAFGKTVDLIAAKGTSPTRKQQWIFSGLSQLKHIMSNIVESYTRIT